MGTLSHKNKDKKSISRAFETDGRASDEVILRQPQSVSGSGREAKLTPDDQSE